MGVGVQLQAFEHFGLGLARIRAGFLIFGLGRFGRGQQLGPEGLEFDRIGASGGGGVDEIMGFHGISIVVDPRLGDHIAGQACADGFRADGKSSYHTVHPPSTTIF